MDMSVNLFNNNNNKGVEFVGAVYEKPLSFSLKTITELSRTLQATSLPRLGALNKGTESSKICVTYFPFISCFYLLNKNKNTKVPMKCLILTKV